MKTKKQLKELAYEITSLEQKINSSKEEKFIKSYMNQIENIMSSLSLNDLIELEEMIEIN